MPAAPALRRDHWSLLTRALRTTAAADRAGVAVAAALQLLGALGAVAVILASRLALEAILAPGASTSALVPPLALLAVATAVSTSVGPLQQQQNRLLAERVAQRTWRQILRVCAAVDLLRFESAAFFSRLDRVSSNAVTRPSAVVQGLLGAIGGALGVAATATALLLIEPVLAAVLLLAGVPAVLASRRASRAEFAFAAAATPGLRRRTYLKLLVSHRQFVTEVRSFDAAPGLLERHAGEDAAHLGRLRRVVRTRQRLSLVTAGASALSLAAVLVVIVLLVDAGRIGLADAGAAAIAARLLAGQLTGVFGSVSTLVESGPFLGDLEDFLADAPAVRPPGTRQALERAVEVRGVTFGYPDVRRPALQDVSITLPRGAVVALVGENGSGKTTLAKVVSGLYAPDAGEVLWDGDRPTTDDLRASVSVLFQHYVRYQMSALDNITISEPVPPDRERAADAARRVGVERTIAELDGGLDGLLGQELAQGSDLSGGQWQRLALARALYRDAPVLVLDEPSAALDPRGEHELFADVRRVLDGRTALLISHRYSSVQLADYIYVLDAGRVVEEGTHAQLVAAGGRYAELYALQSAAYLG